MTTLITGGAGYIGSHTIVELISAGHDIVAADNFSNSHSEVFDRVQQITGRPVSLYHLDVRDATALEEVFSNHDIETVIHFAGRKAVGESVSDPLGYYRNNVDATLTLAEVMQRHPKARNFIFSSSACVYGNTTKKQYDENTPLAPSNPYGWTKLTSEQILRDLAASDPSWHITLLRYFNPIGAHSSGLIGEDPGGMPNNLLPLVAQVAVGKLPELKIFGNDYDTPDGTCIRDFVHVVDVAKGHLAALQHPAATGQASAYNLGTGQGQSVLDIVKAFEKASGKTIKYTIAPRRPGDLGEYYSDVSKAKRDLDWEATKTLDDMCADTWKWQSQNPNGYAKA